LLPLWCHQDRPPGRWVDQLHRLRIVLPGFVAHVAAIAFGSARRCAGRIAIMQQVV
jgi:hypothetical protein